MQEWLNSMSQRERIMVIGCAVFVVLALIWVLAVQPLIQHSSGLAERVESKRVQLTNLNDQAARYTPPSRGGQTRRTGDNQSLAVIIDRTTRERQLAGYLKRNQPEGATSVRLRLESAPFDDMVNWLGDLEDRYGLRVANGNFDRAGVGRVNATLTLARGSN